MRKYVGTYKDGSERVKLYLTDGYGGSFSLVPPTGDMAEIRIGAEPTEWGSVFAALMHESIEFAFTRLQCRYLPSLDWSEDNGGYTFIADHRQLSEACAMAGSFVGSSAPDLKKHWTEYQKVLKNKCQH